ncbi:MAG: hypothetical protein JXB49_00410 [Bacteroidales bacterium]|nr:hypothetical protein [Bacteroidales bacterium]
MMSKNEIIVRDSYIIIRQGDEVYISNITNLDSKLDDQIAFGTILPETLNNEHYLNYRLSNWLSVNSNDKLKLN